LADARFDRTRFTAALRTARLGRTLLAHAETQSTNDDAWDALAQGLPDGVTVVADAQVRGRGRAGRTWTHAPGQGLALSVALALGCDLRHAGLAPLVAGLALADALARLGAPVRLKWPNDVLMDGRKLAGVLCELRRPGAGGEVVVIGVGVNVRQRAADFPGELRGIATSLSIVGVDAAVEDVAAEFLNALEPRWAQLQDGDRGELLGAWCERAAFWGEPVTVNAPGGPVSGVVQRMDDDGALVLRLESGVERRVLAGDLVPADVEAQ
jgi:BirA family transcriptional regulator, biotin operon repressor / biotin---[acetyl-CoA-carboxylase] ligase